MWEPSLRPHSVSAQNMLNMENLCERAQVRCSVFFPWIPVPNEQTEVSEHSLFMTVFPDPYTSEQSEPLSLD